MARLKPRPFKAVRRYSQQDSRFLTAPSARFGMTILFKVPNFLVKAHRDRGRIDPDCALAGSKSASAAGGCGGGGRGAGHGTRIS